MFICINSKINSVEILQERFSFCTEVRKCSSFFEVFFTVRLPGCLRHLLQIANVEVFAEEILLCAWVGFFFLSALGACFACVGLQG